MKATFYGIVLQALAELFLRSGAVRECTILAPISMAGSVMQDKQIPPLALRALSE